MSNSMSIFALSFAAMLAASGPGYAQTPPDPHHPEQGAGTAEAGPAAQDQQGMSMPMMMNKMSGMMKMMGAGQVGTGGMGMGGMGMSDMGMTDHVEGRIAFLRAELRITDTQEKAWEVFAGILRDNAKRMKEAGMPMTSTAAAPGFSAQLDSQERMLAMKLDEVRATRAAFAPLHEALSAEQRKTLDELLATHMNLMPPGMMQGGMMQGMMKGSMMQGGQAPAQKSMQ